MTPIGHTGAALLGLKAAQEDKNIKTLFIFVLLANLPDIDFCFFLFLGPKAFSMHQYFTHNIFFVSLGAGAGALFLKTRRQRLMLCLTAYSHLLLDLFTIDGAAPVGFRLFYPLSERLYNFGIFPNIMKGSINEVFSLHNGWVLGFELLVFSVPVWLVYRGGFAANSSNGS